MNDPFVPDWGNAPEWAMWHIVDPTGFGRWVGDGSEIGISWRVETYDGHPGDTMEWEEWQHDSPDEEWAGRYELGESLDWRNSLRHRPEERK